MSTAKERELARALLTRADVRRSNVGLPKSDESLLQVIVGDAGPMNADCLLYTSKLLRLMDRLLSRRDFGEAFVEKFSEHWLSWNEHLRSPACAGMFESLDGLYQDIQMFCESTDHRAEERLLDDVPQLEKLVISAYNSVLEQWLELLAKSTVNPATGEPNLP